MRNPTRGCVGTFCVSVEKICLQLCVVEWIDHPTGYDIPLVPKKSVGEMSEPHGEFPKPVNMGKYVGPCLGLLKLNPEYLSVDLQSRLFEKALFK